MHRFVALSSHTRYVPLYLCSAAATGNQGPGDLGGEPNLPRGENGPIEQIYDEKCTDLSQEVDALVRCHYFPAPPRALGTWV